MKTRKSSPKAPKAVEPKSPFAAFKSFSAVQTAPENPYVEFTAETLLAYFGDPSKFHTTQMDGQGRNWTYASLPVNTRKGEQTFLFNVSQMNSILSCLKGDAVWPEGSTTTESTVKVRISERDVIRGNQVILRPFVGNGVNARAEV